MFREQNSHLQKYLSYFCILIIIPLYNVPIFVATLIIKRLETFVEIQIECLIPVLRISYKINIFLKFNAKVV